MRVLFLFFTLALSTSWVLPRSSEAFWYEFFTKAVTYPKHEILNIDWYRPTELVKGNEKTLPIPSRKEGSFLDKNTLQKILDYAEKQNSSALLVIHNNQMVLEKYWNGFGSNSKSNSMSMAKTLSALLIGGLIDDGLITSEDEPAASYLPEWRYDSRKDITIKQLLRMESGLYTGTSYKTLIPWLYRFHLGNDLMYYLTNIEPIRPPGEEFEYNNFNGEAIGMIVQNASKKRYAEYMSEKLWKPTGNSDAEVALDHENGLARTYCCYFATPTDWARIGLLLMNQGTLKKREIISKSWIEKMLVPSQHEPEYGYFTWLGNSKGYFKRNKSERSEDFLAKDLFFLDGRGKQRVFILPTQKIVIVRIGEEPKVSSKSQPEKSMLNEPQVWPQKWDDAFIPNTLVRALRNPE